MSPALVSDFMADLVPVEKRAEYKIMDFAAGTGRVGVHLRDRHGFRLMDAVGRALHKLLLFDVFLKCYSTFFLSLDGSREMLDKLEAKEDLYGKVICSLIGGGKQIEGVEE